jgi:hypothetical protein
LSEEDTNTKIEQLLVGTDLTPAQIAKQLNIPVRKVYRHKKWPEVQELRRQRTKKQPPPAPQPEAPAIAFEKVETPPTEEPALAEIKEEPEKEPEKAPEITVEQAKILNLEYGAFKGLIDPAFEIVCEAAGLTKPNPVKIEKLDHALVDFCIAWKIDFGDPRVLPSIILVATIGEIGLPLAQEIRNKRKKPKPEEPKTRAEQVMSNEPAKRPPEPTASNAMVQRAGELLDSGKE